MRSPAIRRPINARSRRTAKNTIDMVTQKHGKTVGDGTIVVATDRKSERLQAR